MKKSVPWLILVSEGTTPEEEQIMTERLPGIYEIELTSDQGVTREIHIFLIPGKPGERSLMIDTGYRKQNCLEKTERILQEFGIGFDRLDVFLTHKHHDHTGLAAVYGGRGARLFMNPEENRHPYDCLYYNHGRNQDSGNSQYRVLRSVGVTPEGTPEVWEMFMEIRRRVENNRGWEYEVPEFSFLPVEEGQRFEYGGYSFEAMALRGHTYGQMGLADRERKILFCGDQIIDGIIPIVGTTYEGDHLLQSYFRSLGELMHRYGDFLLLPAHGKPIREVRRVTERIIFSYLDKADMIKRILDHGRKRMTVREIACTAYGMGNIPEDTDEFVKLKMVMSKTFSCLEYLLDEDFVIRTEEDGTFYWQSASV